MFTGLIQALGTLQPLQPDRLQVTCVSGATQQILEDLTIGDSVAVDGVCLTVIEILANGFVADASPETLQRSTLGQSSNYCVNLETSLRVGSKLGGHFVTGHVDGVGYLQQSVPTATSWEMTFTANDHQVARYVLSKGSIAINGVSLTISACSSAGDWFTVAVIPHTYESTNLHLLRSGNPVNLEGDILGKYVERFLRTDGTTQAIAADISPAFLAEHGYFGR